MFPYSGNLPDCPGKRTAQKIDVTLKICNISCNHDFSFFFQGVQKYLLTACLNLPVEEEASISRQNTVHTTSTMSAKPGRISTKERSATATQVNAWNTEHGHRPSSSWQNICLRLNSEQCQETGVILNKTKTSNQRGRFVGLNHRGSLHAQCV